MPCTQSPRDVEMVVAGGRPLGGDLAVGAAQRRHRGAGAPAHGASAGEDRELQAVTSRSGPGARVGRARGRPPPRVGAGRTAAGPGRGGGGCVVRRRSRATSRGPRDDGVESEEATPPEIRDPFDMGARPESRDRPGPGCCGSDAPCDSSRVLASGVGDRVMRVQRTNAPGRRHNAVGAPEHGIKGGPEAYALTPRDFRLLIRLLRPVLTVPAHLHDSTALARITSLLRAQPSRRAYEGHRRAPRSESFGSARSFTRSGSRGAQRRDPGGIHSPPDGQ